MERGKFHAFLNLIYCEFDMGFVTGHIYSIFIEVFAHQIARY